MTHLCLFLKKPQASWAKASEQGVQLADLVSLPIAGTDSMAPTDAAKGSSALWFRGSLDVLVEGCRMTELGPGREPQT